MGEAMFHITAAWAQLEKRTLIERTRAGMERARAEGKRFARVRDLVLSGHLTRADGARRLRVRYSAFVAALRKGGLSEQPADELGEAS